MESKTKSHGGAAKKNGSNLSPLGPFYKTNTTLWINIRIHFCVLDLDIFLFIWVGIFEWSTVVSFDKNWPKAQFLNLFLPHLSEPSKGFLDWGKGGFILAAVNGTAGTHLAVCVGSAILPFCTDGRFCCL